MEALKKASDAVFGETGLDYLNKGDQILGNAITGFTMMREAPRELTALRTAKITYEAVIKFQKKI